MKIQLLSDLHLETESHPVAPAPGAEVLVLAGDIDATWAALERFAGWPVPVLSVAGNHEFDGRDVDDAWHGLREACARHGIRLLQRESVVLADSAGRRVRFAGCIRWSDFDLFGPAGRPRAMRSANYFLQLMGATRAGQRYDAAALREDGLACRAWLERELSEPPQGRWDVTVAITHFGPSLRSADPRYGATPSTASFCNADDDLIPRADLWLHGHLHCRHDYRIERPGRRPSRVVCHAAGLSAKGESAGWSPAFVVEI